MNAQTEKNQAANTLSKPQLILSGQPILYNPVEIKKRQAGMCTMRKRFHTAFGKVFRTALIRERDRMGLTQEQMAELLCMSNYGYTKLEHGKSGCGGTTLFLFLIRCCPDIEQFISDLKKAYVEAWEDDYAKL